MSLDNINGLKWHDACVEEGRNGSSVTWFPTTHLVHLVFHGDRPFRHTHYGIHLGFSDRLTFLGPSSRTLRGYFVDCRKDSPTLHERASIVFSPSTKRTLYIPCGVAHAFEGMEGIFTINSFDASLPEPSLLLTNESPWATGADIQYFELDAKDSELPSVQENVFSASETFYDLLSEMQATTLGGVAHEYPHTEEVEFPDGTRAKVMVRRPVTERQKIPSYEAIPEIPGLGWQGHLVVWSGSHAGYSALVDRSPINVIDYKTSPYCPSEYQVDAEFENCLTILGPSSQTAKIKIIDCRYNSPTCHREHVLEFQPSALRFLCIPPGVAYALEHQGGLFTINRPRKCGKPAGAVSDSGMRSFPMEGRSIPTLDVQKDEAPLDYYKALAKTQQERFSTAGAV
jgi:dTDP-4-dehydrorhamnose 3,5-epimerase-like enzyme